MQNGIYIMQMGHTNELRVLGVYEFLSQVDGNQDDVICEINHSKKATEVLLNDGEWYFASHLLSRVVAAKRREYNDEKRNIQYYLNELKEWY